MHRLNTGVVDKANTAVGYKDQEPDVFKTLTVQPTSTTILVLAATFKMRASAVTLVEGSPIYKTMITNRFLVRSI